MQTNFLVFDGAPQSFCKNIVHGAPTSIHADFDFFALQAFQIFLAGEVAALVAVPDFRFGLKQGVVYGSQHEIHLQGLAERPANNIARIPVQNGGEIQPSMLSPYAGDTCPPGVASAPCCYPSSERRVNLELW